MTLRVREYTPFEMVSAFLKIHLTSKLVPRKHWMLVIKIWTTKESALDVLRVQQETWESTNNDLRLVNNQETIANCAGSHIKPEGVWTLLTVGYPRPLTWSGKATEECEI